MRRIVLAGRGGERPEDVLASIGISPEPEGPSWAGESIDADAYYDAIERVAGPDEHGLPFRYAESLHPDELGALGLALKTAPTAGDALRRLVRYILVLSDTLEYELVDHPWGRAFTLLGRPPLRRGVALANECALASVTSLVRQIVGDAVAPREVTFRHDRPATDEAHRAFFGCPVTFSAPDDALHLGRDLVERPTLLGDEGLSAFFLARLDDLRSRTAERSLLVDVRDAVADSLPDGQPSKSQVARRLGMSERTLHRRLAEEGESFQSLATQARRDAAESLLRAGTHNLAEVAFLTGFSDQTAFTRAFKRWTGQTPAAFREQHA